MEKLCIYRKLLYFCQLILMYVMDHIFYIIGMIGILFLIGFGYLIFLRKIVFDRILVNGFFKYVILIVLFPFIFFGIFRYDSSELLAESPSCPELLSNPEDSLHLLWAYFYHFLDINLKLIYRRKKL